jgi:protoporphyrinogen oxidase
VQCIFFTGDSLTARDNQALIIGGGLAGLSAGYALSRAGFNVSAFESGPVVGGISRTIEHNGFRFDIGPHRFFTKDPRLEAFVKDLMGEELITVPRRTEIFIRGKYFDYPLEPVNAVFGMGLFTTLKILGDYGVERIKRLFHAPDPVSLEDWVVANFGRALFDIYFKEYSEKVWGIPCGSISAEWVARRIRGLSLSSAIANAFFKIKGKDIPSLVDEFLYPRRGIGRLSDKLAEGIARSGAVYTDSMVERISRSGFTVESISVRDRGGSRTRAGAEFVSSIPITKLIALLDPPPPPEILEAASRLAFRDLIVVAVMIDRKRVTDQTWIYIPERNIPFGRIHEPTNWSREMAPEGKTLLVTEFFSFQGDALWKSSDDELTGIAVDSLERLGYIKDREVIESVVVRAPHAYPLFEIGYEKHLDVMHGYLSQFPNLRLAGRAGRFEYYNMDHAIGSGIRAAEDIIEKKTA